MGRKKKINPPARMKQFTMRVTEEMYENLKQNADAAHLSVMAYTRHLLSNRRPVVHNEIVYNNPDLLKALGDIGKIGNNLNQIARYLNEYGDQIPRDFYLLDGVNCNPYTFNEECQAINAHYGKNQTHSEIKAHHYIISFDPRDRDENDLTPEKAHVLVRQFARQNFPGHQMIVCTHKDGHNSAGNIHVHIILNSVRKIDVMRQEFMERDCDAKAGNKHHVTNGYLSYLKQAVIEMCQEQDLYQVDLLSPARVKITDREYWAKRHGQAYLDKQNAENSKCPKLCSFYKKTELVHKKICLGFSILQNRI